MFCKGGSFFGLRATEETQNVFPSMLRTSNTSGIDLHWLYIVYRPVQEYFTHTETSLLPVKVLCWRPLSREGTWPYHTGYGIHVDIPDIIQRYWRPMLIRIPIFAFIGREKYVCLEFFVHSRIFHSYEDVIITTERLQILTYTHGHWAVRYISIPNLLCHGTTVYNGYLWGPMTFTPVAGILSIEAVTVCYTTVDAGIQTPNLLHARQTL